MSALALRIAGIGAWSPRHGAWPQWRAALRGETADAIDAPRPPATVLPQAERRRAPSTVLLACEAAAQACAMSSLDAANLPCVFACKHGEVAISDDMFATLAADPRALSPTRFHNSVHNAPVGYWTLATQCHAASNALSAWRDTFAAALFEAAALAVADATPVLFAAYDAAASGPLANVMEANNTFALAFVLDPVSSGAGPHLRLRHVADVASASADALALLRVLARADFANAKSATLSFPAGDGRRLDIEVSA